MNYMSICDNKGCRKEIKAIVDKETLIAYCPECGKQVNNISIFMRRQMVALGQVKKDDDVKQLAWAVKCHDCGKTVPPKLVDGKLLCNFCEIELTELAKPFAETLKSMLKSSTRK